MGVGISVYIHQNRTHMIADREYPIGEAGPVGHMWR